MKQVQEPEEQEQSQVKNTCSHCENFTTLNVSPTAAKHGVYRCTGFLTSIEVNVSWDQPRCGGYRAAKNQGQRETWIAKRAQEAITRLE